jgi:hypothetical protein
VAEKEKEIPQKYLDRRTIERHLKRGNLDEKELQRHLKSLPDLAEQAVKLETEFEDDFG